jgi:DNA polymerase III subunit beta
VIDSTSEGSVAVPAKLLLEILKTFPDQPLSFSVEENSTIEISSNSGKYALAYALGEEFPKSIQLDDPSVTLVPADVLSTAVGKTLFAAGNDDLRPIMSGVFFQFSPQGLIFVATDAHKLVKYARTDVSSSQVADFVMPKKPLTILKNILTASDVEVKIEYNESNAAFSFENYNLICRLIDGKYPNYEAVIPKENPNKLMIDRVQFLNSVRRVAIFSRIKYFGRRY